MQPREASQTKHYLKVSSPAFKDGGTIPKTYTADGEDTSPPLSWTEPPPGTVSFAVLCEDPDAPSGTFVHWLLWDVRAEERNLEEAVPPTADAFWRRQGENHFGRTGYGGPKPPPGPPHRYMFHVYALDDRLNLRSGATREDFDQAVREHYLAEGEIVGMYGR